MINTDLSTLLEQAEKTSVKWQGSLDATLADAFALLERRNGERVVAVSLPSGVNYSDCYARVSGWAKRSLWGADVYEREGLTGCILVGEEGRILHVTWD